MKKSWNDLQIHPLRPYKDIKMNYELVWYFQGLYIYNFFIQLILLYRYKVNLYKEKQVQIEEYS